MKRLCLQSLTTLMLFGIIVVVCGSVSSARADDPPNIQPISPTNGATVVVGPGSAKLAAVFKTHNGFAPRLVEVLLNGSPTTLAMDPIWFAFDGIEQIYTGYFSVSTGSYPNTVIKIHAIKPGNSGGNPTQEASLTLTGIEVIKL